MKIGSLVIRCFKCGNQIGWYVPTGKDKKTGAVVYEDKVDSKVKLIPMGWGSYYCCEACRKENK